MKNKDFIGTKINGLKIVNYFPKDGRQYFSCHCICGFVFAARVDAVKSGRTSSCGCLRGELISEKNKLPNNKAALNLILRNYKRNAKKKKLKFSLSFKEFESFVYKNCYYCNSSPKLTKLSSGQPNRKDKEISYNGIDRIDNNRGYVIGNCVTCCSICNRAKSDLSFTEFKEWIARLKDFNE